LRGASPEALFLECLPVPKGIVEAARRRGHEVRTFIGNSVAENSGSSQLLAEWMRRLRRVRPVPRIDSTLWQSWRDRGLVRWRPDIYIYCGAVPSSRTATRLKELGALLVQYMGISPKPLSPDDPVRRGLASADVAVCNSDQIEQEAEELGC